MSIAHNEVRKALHFGRAKGFADRCEDSPQNFLRLHLTEILDEIESHQIRLDVCHVTKCLLRHEDKRLGTAASAWTGGVRRVSGGSYWRVGRPCVSRHGKGHSSAMIARRWRVSGYPCRGSGCREVRGQGRRRDERGRAIGRGETEESGCLCGQLEAQLSWTRYKVVSVESLG
jgi:hypothetical protein